MENIRIVKSISKHFICDEIKYIATNKEAVKEIGEPFIYMLDQTWIFSYIDGLLAGFICYNNSSIVYVYVIPEFRGNGIFTILYNELPVQQWITIANNASYKLFIKKGFEVVKNYKTCHKLIKK